MSYQEASFAQSDDLDDLTALDRLAGLSANATADASRVMPTAAATIVSFPNTVAEAQVSSTGTAPVARSARPAIRPYRAIGKRVFDVACIVAAAPIWLPLMMVFALLAARDGHNPFYTQDRVGRGGRIFRMIKLRSMVPNAEAKLEAHLAADPAARAEWDATQKLKNDPRITPIGQIIRKTSIDELPQLLNVLKGDMSLVGPRPFMTCQVALYDGDAYYKVRPGLTGYWQVSDRNECEFAERVGFDEAYERDLSFPTDMSILLRTVSVVARATGY